MDAKIEWRKSKVPEAVELWVDGVPVIRVYQMVIGYEVAVLENLDAANPAASTYVRLNLGELATEQDARKAAARWLTNLANYIERFPKNSHSTGKPEGVQ